jgi:hypothetical protein
MAIWIDVVVGIERAGLENRVTKRSAMVVFQSCTNIHLDGLERIAEFPGARQFLI